MDSIKYINTNGILAVTGDYSNWIFCREFHPTADGHASDHYWEEKLRISSCQKPSRYSAEETEKEIRRMLDDPEGGWLGEDREFLQDLLSKVDDELEYTYFAYRESPRGWDSESIPFAEKTDYHFLAVLDGFDEICRRLKGKESSLEVAEEPHK